MESLRCWEREGQAAAFDLGQTFGSIRPRTALLLAAGVLFALPRQIPLYSFICLADTVCESARALATASCDSCIHERGSFVPISRDKWAGAII